ncbi:hypothetical protein MKW94_011119 [Papaver nudicaule]|uniref:Fatty acyl-CoA reductase n=1 Tax=Papaver nudicaule TaxID=74823 RepID=A0AA41S651_PAPNU|nr:hypothetical protein [Papaver nudicaule]
MELNGIVQSLENKSILVTVFVEKILRVQPDIKQLFLLLRPADTSCAVQRLHNDVTGKEVFRELRKKYGHGFDSFISKKVTPLFGDVSLENLGIKDYVLRKKMHEELDIVANFAATTNFDERYNVALDVNTLGAKHVLDFANNCENLKMILHISTAYINTGETPGVILEEPFDINQTMKENSKFLDIEEERKLAQERLNELKAAQVSKNQETTSMKVLGLQRNVPVVIARPTIVSSTYKDPFPGWIEGVKYVLYNCWSSTSKLPVLRTGWLPSCFGSATYFHLIQSA